MAKFEKRIALSITGRSSDYAALTNSTHDNFTELNPYRWEVRPKSGDSSFDVDFSDFAEIGGNLSIERSRLLGQLVPVLRKRTFGLVKRDVVSVRSTLRALWRFLDERWIAGEDLYDVSKFDNSTGSLFKSSLLGSGLATRYATRQIIIIRSWVSEARRHASLPVADLAWPGIASAPGAYHKDVTPAALQLLYLEMKSVHDRTRRSLAQGQLWLSSRDKSKATSTLITTSDVDLSQPLITEILSEIRTAYDNDGGRSWHGRSYALDNARPESVEREVVRRFAPLHEDTATAFLIVLLHTGWNPSTVLSIDISMPENWFDARLAGDHKATVAIYGNKGRGDREQVAFSLSTPWCHPFQVIRRQIEHTKVLRESIGRTSETDQLAGHHLQGGGPGAIQIADHAKISLAVPKADKRQTQNSA